MAMKDLTKILKSLEDETRLRIMALLCETDELCVCHLIPVLQLPQSTVSRHLAHLKNARWLKDRRQGLWIYYSLAGDLSSLQGAFIATLRPILSQTEAAGKDRERLKKLFRENCCP